MPMHSRRGGCCASSPEPPMEAPPQPSMWCTTWMAASARLCRPTAPAAAMRSSSLRCARPACIGGHAPDRRDPAPDRVRVRRPGAADCRGNGSDAAGRQRQRLEHGGPCRQRWPPVPYRVQLCRCDQPQDRLGAPERRRGHPLQLSKRWTSGQRRVWRRRASAGLHPGVCQRSASDRYHRCCGAYLELSLRRFRPTAGGPRPACERPARRHQLHL